jgi:hypothetical protein
MNEIVFKPSVLETRPDRSFVMKFPKFTLTLMFSKGKMHAEILDGTARSTFESEVRDNQEEFDKIMDKVLKNVSSIVRIDHKK